MRLVGIQPVLKSNTEEADGGRDDLLGIVGGGGERKLEKRRGIS